MSAVVKKRNAEMKILAAGLVVLTALALTGCSRQNFERSITRFRDRVVADAATAEAQRSLQPKAYDDGGYNGYYRDPLKQAAAKPVGPDGKPITDDTTTTTGSTDPAAPPKPFEGQAAAPPTVYYYQTAPIPTQAR